MSAHGLEYLQGPSSRRLNAVGGLALAVALFPAGAAAAVATMYDHGTLNPFYQQKRPNGFGAYTTILKFRTLHTLSDDLPLITYGTFDPRASRIGSALRQSGLDEYPQLMNVITGSMSLVGRRQVLDDERELMHDADPAVYKDWEESGPYVPSGLTSEAQIYRHHQRVVTPEVRVKAMKLDIEYPETASLRGDLAVIGRTPIELLKAAMQRPVPAPELQTAVGL